MTTDQFLTKHWQKLPLFIPKAIEETGPTLSQDELAWLALQSDVESRLVFTEQDGGKTRYRLEDGPFTESELSSLPNENWTLLVQDVEKHIPDFRAWFDHIDFIPQWRIDDLMVSFAAPGGSVGPHKDGYDVFLCQGEGRREWRVGAKAPAQIDDAAIGLSLLEPFDPVQSITADTGDVFYLPPGLPHWGVARSFCMTWSIGMRAPTKAELLAGADRVFDTECIRMPESGETSAVYYQDPDLRAEEANGRRISSQTLHRIREQNLLDASYPDERLATILGSAITDPKVWLTPDTLSIGEAQEILQRTAPLPVHGMSKLAWYESDSVRIAFANGTARDMPVGCIDLMHQICAHCPAPAIDLHPFGADSRIHEFAVWLLAQGVFDVDSKGE